MSNQEGRDALCQEHDTLPPARSGKVEAGGLSPPGVRRIFGVLGMLTMSAAFRGTIVVALAVAISSCHTVAPQYVRVAVHVSLADTSTEQNEVIKRMGTPLVVWRGPWGTTRWGYCIDANTEHWVEFDSNGAVLSEGQAANSRFCTAKVNRKAAP